jgi:hypothetical protein
MPAAWSTRRFVAANLGVWLVMVIILVVVPDWLEQWMALELARGIGWAVAGLIWVVAVETEWKARFGPFSRSFLQLVLWVGAALLAIWISEQANLRTGI